MMDIDDLKTQVQQYLVRVKRYLPLLFIALVVICYGYLVYRVQVLNNAEPSGNDITNQSRTAQVPHIDPAVLTQLQQLQDNSVNVQTLFSQARSNPFGE